MRENIDLITNKIKDRAKISPTFFSRKLDSRNGLRYSIEIARLSLDIAENEINPMVETANISRIPSADETVQTK
jgi:hypothetical protein